MKNLTNYEYMLLASKHAAIHKKKKKTEQIESIYRYDLLSRFYFLYENLKVEEKNKIAYLSLSNLSAFLKTGTCNFLGDYIRRLSGYKKSRNGKLLSLKEKHNEIIYPVLIEMNQINSSKIIDVELKEESISSSIYYDLNNYKDSWQVILGEPYLFFSNGLYSLRSGLFLILRNDEIVLSVKEGDFNDIHFNTRKVFLQENIKKADLENVYTNEYSSIVTHLASLPLDELIYLSKANYKKTLAQAKKKKNAA